MAHKNAYLTIDDAPSPHMRQKLDFLLSHNIPAIFFCEGRKMEERPEPVIYAIQQGFVIGNHSYNHPHFSAISLEQSWDEIQHTDEIVERLYAQAGIPRPAKYFRFPYGDKGTHWEQNPTEKTRQHCAAIQQQLRQLGYMQPDFPHITYAYYHDDGFLQDADWYWTFDTLDWSVFSDEPMYGITSLEAVYARIAEDLPEEARGLHFPNSEDIVLIHDHEISTDIFYPIVERLVETGLNFKLPDELL